MVKYRLSVEAKNDLIRIHQYGVKRFGMQRELFAEMSAIMKAQGYKVPDNEVLDAIQGTRA